jgi:tetratricopeptide (TPR) repeat protein
MGVAAVAATLVLGFGGVLRHDRVAIASSALPTAVVEQLQRGFATGDTQALVAGLQAELRADGTNAKAYASLGLAYQQRARETGDASYYGKAEGALRRALALHPDDLVATAGLGQLALSRHQFREALSFGRRARALSPTTAGVYGVLGDAELELGRYTAAFRDFDRMASLKPGVSSYARVSYARELLGRPAGAAQAMQLAISAAVGEREAGAWTRVQLGLLYLATGRAGLAAVEMRQALHLFPGYAFGLDGMAQAELALGHPAAALRYEQAAVDLIPLPQYVGLLGDLYHAAGRPRLARQQYSLIGVIERLLAANGVRNDLDIALFDVDHDLRLPHALALARRGYLDRPSIFGDDVLGWALARNGRCQEALHYSTRSLRLGTKDALKFFHRGFIEACLGDRAAARASYGRALALNPHFSILWAPLARKGVST